MNLVKSIDFPPSEKMKNDRDEILVTSFAY